MNYPKLWVLQSQHEYWFDVHRGYYWSKDEHPGPHQDTLIRHVEPTDLLVYLSLEESDLNGCPAAERDEYSSQVIVSTPCPAWLVIMGIAHFGDPW